MNSSTNQQLVRQVVDWVLSKKAENVMVMDLAGVLDVTDWFVLCTGFSEIQVQAIADAVVDGAIAVRNKPLHVEGQDRGRWVLIDFVDVVVHVMLPEERDRYRLDRLWGDAGIVAFDETGAARHLRSGVEGDVDLELFMDEDAPQSPANEEDR